MNVSDFLTGLFTLASACAIAFAMGRKYGIDEAADSLAKLRASSEPERS